MRKAVAASDFLAATVKNTGQSGVRRRRYVNANASNRDVIRGSQSVDGLYGDQEVRP
jgi:hypothetical protein